MNAGPSADSSLDLASSTQMSPDDFLTPDGQYRIEGCEMGLLGSGAHGIVRIAQHVQTMEYVAVKITPTSVVRSSCKEMTALARLSSPYVVQLLGVQVDMHKEKVYVIMELCQGGELFDRIAECGGLEEEEAKRYFAQVLSALRHCHTNGIFHRDLKPENILLDDEDNAKVADFGLAAVYQHVKDDASFLQHTKVGSVMYAAPEVLVSTASSGYDAARADMWSLGIILFSMLSGTLPFECAAASRCKRYAAVLRQGIQVMCPEHLSSQVTSLLARLLHPEPSQRFTPQQALDSEWLRGAAVARGEAEPSKLPRSWTIMFRLATHQLKNATIGLGRLAAQDASLAAGVVPRAAGEGGVVPRAAVDGGGVAPQPAAARADGAIGGMGSPTKRKRESIGGQTSPSTPSAASACGVHASGSVNAKRMSPSAGLRVEGIPLQGCISQFIQTYGWEPLPCGTEQLLRDIFQTLHDLGLEYSLQEQQSEAETLPDAGIGESAGSSRSGDRVLLLKIDFGGGSESPGCSGGRPLAGTTGSVT
uniref:non-specific serine/threonine protein kinase n=1 Tax=Calcidiscus leptoporus TaxID=127549 RepID=A0A7S0INV0_9EUKA|mmetsp:Transcript_14387/g.32869  ORF Transcript_14387/g.32869 Transcript_14387/m.32869 type:complete len:534 (+) Transcript_14387:131-1732(+)